MRPMHHCLWSWRCAFVTLACVWGCSGSSDAAGTPEAGEAPVDAGEFDQVDPYSTCVPPSTYSPDEEAGCGPGGVTFQLLGQPGDEWWLTDTQGANSTSTNWLTILSCDGQLMLDIRPTPQTTSRDCTACPTAWSLTLSGSTWELPSGGQTQTWTGACVVPGNCGDPPEPCVTPSCASASRFIAQMCACAPGDQTPNGCQNPVCVQVPFNYPAQALVTGTLPSAAQ